ncbi:hypothetical protein CFOL_v3_20167 [Cephalotus follicularis]|uniref:Uncharacterized protein n=1 Tax=Cephalotus follicularis TaxID=3775 RepID=A0A1Q3C905_CEPFO|nr:hypothetical protein CFOL_v3_20167 [Cephalotus follicularis]
MPQFSPEPSPPHSSTEKLELWISSASEKKLLNRMAEMCGSNALSTDSMVEFSGPVWSNELDHVPLIQRRKLLLSRNQDSKSNPVSSPLLDVVVKKEEGLVSLPFGCTVKEGTDQQCHFSKVSSEVISGVAHGKVLAEFGAVAQCSQDVGMTGYFNSQGTQVKKHMSDKLKCAEVNNDAAGSDVSGHTSIQIPMPSALAKVKAEISDGELLCSDGSNGTDLPMVVVKDNILNDCTDDELDHIVLKERQKMLLTRKLSGSTKQVLEGNSIGISEEIIGHCDKTLKETMRSVDGESSMVGKQFNHILERNNSDLWQSSLDVSSKGIAEESSFTANWYLPKPCVCLGTATADSRNDIEESEICSSMTSSVNFSSCNGQDYVPASIHSMSSSALPNFKVEPMDDNGLHNSNRNPCTNYSFNTLRVEPEVYDKLDHMQLFDRMMLLTSGEKSELNSSRNSECLWKSMPSDVGRPFVPESTKQISIIRRRKRKKTATDSVETALEEDAPGLLQVLIDQGVSVDEIKLYGEQESDDALDESLNEVSFADLEAVMSKIFSPWTSTSLLKFAPMRCTNATKPSYCLACLFSLVEQTRYLQFRKWPVEWGWCRDLQSFIFVFERHNRIVLERPEYGYATYFFELVDTLPIKWQVKRLVTAMKLTSCGRITLIENKAIRVGEDLTEGEAQVLMEYGWIPNSGLGTMLNYCDRVIHDRKNEKDTSEWRSKIGKMLINGYNGGTTVSFNMPEKVIDGRGAASPQIKLEL